MSRKKKANILVLLLALTTVALVPACKKKKQAEGSLTRSSLVREISDSEYRKLIYDYKKGGEFTSKNELPVIIDFYTEWCQPCKMLSPILDKLSLAYEGRVLFYKVNTEKNRALMNLHGIEAFPSLNFIPPKAKSSMIGREMGYREEKGLDDLILKYFGEKR